MTGGRCERILCERCGFPLGELYDLTDVEPLDGDYGICHEDRDECIALLKAALARRSPAAAWTEE